MKFRKMLVVSLLGLLFLTGCTSGLKKLSTFKTPSTAPSWAVDMRVPLVKGTLPLGEKIEELLADTLPEDQIIQPGENDIFTYETSMDFDRFGLNAEDIQLETGDLSIDGIEWGGDPNGGPAAGGAIQLDNVVTFSSPSFPVNIDEGLDMVVAPKSVTLENAPSVSIPFTFDAITFSNLQDNRLTFKLSTNEPLDELKIEMYAGERLGDHTLIGTASWVDVATLSGISLNPDGTALEGTFTDTKYISFAGMTIDQNSFYYDITVTAHTTQATATLEFGASPTMEIVEVVGGDATDFGLGDDVLNISLEELKPFSALPIKEVGFESGMIKINEQKNFAGNNFLFDVNLTLKDTSTGIEYNWLEPNPDGGWIIDLTGRTITKDLAISANVTPNIDNYDVWDGTQIVPYSYSLGIETQDLAVNSLTVPSDGLGDFIEDPNPDTEVWDISFEETDVERFHVEYPEGFNLGIGDFDLDMEIDNNTDLQGTVKLGIYSYESEVASEPIEFTEIELELKKRSVFKLSEQTGYNDFVDDLIALINNQPKYIAVVPGGSFQVTDSITVTTDDYVEGSVSAALPLALTLKKGGMTLEGAFDEHVDLEADQREILETMGEFIKEASLNIDYVNESALGFGGKATFSAPGYESQAIEFTIQPAFEGQVAGKAKFGVTSKLFEILANPDGFDLKVDMTLPNDTDQDQILAIKSTDEIELNLYMDGLVDVHVPSDM